MPEEENQKKNNSSGIAYAKVHIAAYFTYLKWCAAP